MRRAVCPGSFDPLHLGHVDVIRRAAALFDEVIVAASVNPSKRPLFSMEQRLAMIEESLQGVPGVRAVPLGGGLISEFCREHGAVALVKGLRSGADFEYEKPMAVMNRELSGVETVYLTARPSLTHLSSSLIKEIHSLDGDVSAFVPAPVLRGFETIVRE